jgi:hypothetical protein
MSERRAIILSTIREIGGLEGKLRRFLQCRKELMLGPITRIIEQGIAEGEFRRVDAELSALSLLGMIHAVITFRLLLQDKDIDCETADQTLSLFLQGILKQDS